MEVIIDKKGSNARFTVKGDIDERGAEILKNRFQEMNRLSVKQLVFDFKEVSYIGSSGIGKLLLFYKDLATSGGSIVVENVSEDIHELLMDLDLDTIITIKKAK